MAPIFLDRDGLTAELVRLVTRVSTGSIILICGAEGVGKTAFIEQALGLTNIDYESVEVGHRGDAPFEPDSLAVNLAQAVGKRSHLLGVPAFDEYQRMLRSKVRKEDLAESVATGLAGAVGMRDVLKQLLEPRGQSPQVKLRSALLAEDMEELAMLYLVEHWPTDALVVHIKDGHQLSRRDWTLMCQLSARAAQPQFLCEIRTAANETPSEFSHYPSTARATALNVAPLERKYAEQLFAHCGEPAATLLMEKFATSGGNLHPFRKLHELSEKDAVKFLAEDQLREERLTRRLVDGLTAMELEVLHLVAAHHGPMDLLVLIHVFDPSTSVKLTDILESLSEADLIVDLGQRYAATTSVRHVIDDGKFRMPQLAATQRLRTLYTHCGSELCTEPREVESHLLMYSARLGDLPAVASRLRAIVRTGVASINPRSAVLFVGKLIDGFSSTKSPSMRRFIKAVVGLQAQLLYEAGWYADALACLDKIPSLPTRLRYLKIELLNLLGQHARALLEVELELKRIPDIVSSHWLCLILLKLHCLRRSNRLKETRSLYERASTRLLNDEGLPAYTTFLRFADPCLYLEGDFERVCASLEMATERARAPLKRRELVAALIAHSQVLAYTEQVEQSKRILSQAAEEDMVGCVERYSILNNSCAINLMNGTANHDTTQKLQTALALSNDPLDRILIENNILSAHAILGQPEAAVKVARHLSGQVDKLSCIDQEILKLSLFNIAMVFGDLGRAEEAQPYWERFRTIRTELSADYWRHKECDGSDGDHALPWYRCRYFTPLITHWHLGPVPFEAVPDDDSDDIWISSTGVGQG
ncbi:hypothetical protein ABAZ39_13135 [Azospirillum argentinense]|uniref:Uncharacterized protein n=1 Tax=Azospirillum argentinense TaxID=2970906 RepID=A0A060DPW2_9PROT|nr:hypothetical protein [Azospirillum argentinense]AIB12914.1 hypothetical protein ABAZ39_13135 [Azospirillum argentinense]EZQ02192.1 hypothetical protein ABAZ39_33215 [Azospirillum argentinense]